MLWIVRVEAITGIVRKIPVVADDWFGAVLAAGQMIPFVECEWVAATESSCPVSMDRIDIMNSRHYNTLCHFSDQGGGVSEAEYQDGANNYSAVDNATWAVRDARLSA
jgi:hypothetical protein